MKSVKDKTLVKVAFSINDILGLLKDKFKYQWTTQQCKDFLTENECLISDRMCEVGWEVIENEIKRCNNPGLGFIKEDPVQILGIKRTVEARWYLGDPIETNTHVVIQDNKGNPLTHETPNDLHQYLLNIQCELIPPSKDHKLGMYEKQEVFYLI